MKSISVGVHTLLTGTEIAEAVLRLGVALARHRELDTVDIPVIVEDGTTARAGFAVGWQSDTLTLTAPLPAGVEELVEPGTVIDLLDRAERVGCVRGQAFRADDLTDQWPNLDLDWP
ncbi:hypothetical protein [Leifsonia sp. fls2-241-R2A-40a]|uniref:hypothetical protein n=1 Tax=Leifsonia sp. fls2-241-R2A-40a TaxID=3040290 RepID=UPI00254DF301|nr:hypothetical protein [Leifsonia sp. fls2-241-R2A-40a]